MNILTNPFYRMKKYFQAPWSVKDIISVIIISGILIILATVGLQYFNVKELIEGTEHQVLIFAGIFLLQWLAVLVPFIIITKKKYKLKWKHFGFKKIGILRTIGLVLSSYLLYIGISILIAVFILYTNIRIPGYQVQEEILPIFGNGIPNLIIVGVMVVGIAPIVEELIFRGFFLRTLSNKIGVFWGSILTATIFAVLHVPWQSFIPIFILGLIINRMVIHSKSLWPAIVFHMLNNSIVFAVAIAIENDLINLEELVILIS